VRWRIYYEDGSTEDDDSRPYGVVSIVQEDEECGRLIFTGWDYYILLEAGWMGLGYDSFVYYVTHKLKEVKHACVGVMVHRSEYQRIQKLAINDPDFPRKSATMKQEKPLESVGRTDG